MDGPTQDVVRSTLWGLAVALALCALIYLGSRGLRDFDTALVPYAGASVLSIFGLGYRYSMWLRRPPTALYWRRGWQLFLRPAQLPRNLARLVKLAWDNLLTQRFIERRSHGRWAAHLLIFWGCVLAAAVTFPLSFGWVRFATSPGSQERYDAFVFGLHVFSFPIEGAVAALTYNILDIAAVLVLGGIAIALYRRAVDRSALTLQRFSNDLVPLILLFVVSVTGVLLTVSTHYLEGFHYGFLAQLHAVVVIFTLLYLPFGKFFHIFQRPAQLSLAFYREAGQSGPQATCLRCQQPFASGLHVGDLKQVEAALGIRYQAAGSHYQDVCPGCRRKALALAQGALMRAAGLRGRESR